MLNHGAYEKGIILWAVKSQSSSEKIWTEKQGCYPGSWCCWVYHALVRSSFVSANLFLSQQY